MIEILAVGKKHESWLENGITRYEKRLTKPYSVIWTLIPHSKLHEATAARHDETTRLLARISSSDYVILLDEHGTIITSPALASHLEVLWSNTKSIKIIIGGAYGVTNTMSERADFVWSLSKLVFPHQLVRLILIEQIYRAQSIAHDRAYHHQ